MSESPEKTYDVAISFLVQDLMLAQALRDKLAESLTVFFFPHNQEELAGTDGLESMRAPFFSESRISVVLFRQRWGNTPWTRVEETAIKDGCLNNGWDGLFFYMVENATPPKWLPSTHVRFNAGDFPLEQAVGAIKARVSSSGGQFQAMTPARKALLFREEEEYRRAKSRLMSDGASEIEAAVDRLFAALLQQCISSGITAEVAQKRHGDLDQSLLMSGDTAATNAIWHRPFTNTLDGSKLIILDFDQRMRMPSEMVGRMYINPPKQSKQRNYEPALSRWREFGWTDSDTVFLSSEELAGKLLIDLFDRMNLLAESAEQARRDQRTSWGY